MLSPFPTLPFHCVPLIHRHTPLHSDRIKTKHPRCQCVVRNTRPSKFPNPSSTSSLIIMSWFWDVKPQISLLSSKETFLPDATPKAWCSKPNQVTIKCSTKHISVNHPMLRILINKEKRAFCVHCCSWTTDNCPVQ